jgi:hypothetical protein
MIGALLGAMAFAMVPAASAQDAGKWEVKVTPGECSLVRSVAVPAPALLALRTVPGTDDYIVLLSGKDVPRRGSSFPVKLAFDGTKTLEVTASPAGKMAAGPAIQLYGLKPAMLDAFGEAHTVGASSGGLALARFDIPRAGAAAGALRKCVADQLVEWGADPAQFEPGGSPPVALKERDDWLTKAQYLALADTMSGGEADYLFRVTVSTDGAIDGCKRNEARAKDKAEKLGCAPVMGRKLFTPASNAAGVPVRGAAAFRVMLISRPN